MPENPPQVTDGVGGENIQQLLLKSQNVRIAFHLGANRGDGSGRKTLHDYGNWALRSIQFIKGSIDALQSPCSRLDGLLDCAFELGQQVSPGPSGSCPTEKIANTGERYS